MKDLSATPSPFFSVIIPTRDRPLALGRCLGALAELDYPPEAFEIIVVDDGSEHSLEPVVQPWRSRLPLQLLRQEVAGPGRARNRGAAAAKGEWLAFVDDDCRPAPGWLRAFAAVDAKEDEALGGATSNAISDNPFSVASQQLIDFVRDWLLRSESPFRFVPSNNFAVSAKGFRRLEGFSPDFPQAAAEDRDFCHRWLRAGGDLRIVDDAAVDHEHRLGPLSFWRQQFHYGRGAFIFHDRRARLDRARMRVLPLRFYVALAGFPWRTSRGGLALLGSALLTLSCVANASGYFFQRALEPRGRSRAGQA